MNLLQLLLLRNSSRPRSPAGASGSSPLASRKEAFGVAELAVLMLQDPLRDPVVARKPDVRVGGKHLQQLVEHRGHQRPAAKMTVKADMDQPHGFMLEQIFERILV